MSRWFDRWSVRRPEGLIEPSIGRRVDPLDRSRNGFRSARGRTLALITVAALAQQGCGAPLTFFVAPVQPVHVGTPQVMPHAIPTDLRQWGAWAVGSF